MLSFQRLTVLSCVLGLTLGQFIPIPGVQVSEKLKTIIFYFKQKTFILI